VLGIEHPRGIAVVRSLGRRGIPVVGVERDPQARGRGSRYLQQVVRPALADLAQFAGCWRASLREWVAGRVVPPTSTLGVLARGLRRR
jgi:hypothetical protein